MSNIVSAEIDEKYEGVLFLAGVSRGDIAVFSWGAVFFLLDAAYKMLEREIKLITRKIHFTNQLWFFITKFHLKFNYYLYRQNHCSPKVHLKFHQVKFQAKLFF